MMKKFYGNINDVDEEYLLTATPFSIFPQLNFEHNLTEDVFFNDLYVGRSNSEGIETTRQNDLFDDRIALALRSINNRFEKVNLINIAGYAGCGKTTYIHSLLRNLRQQNDFMYMFVDYEQAPYAEQPFIDSLSDMMSKETPAIIAYLSLITDNKIFIADRFRRSFPILTQVIIDLESVKQNGNTSKEEIGRLLELNRTKFNDGNVFLYFLMDLEFLLLMRKVLMAKEKYPFVLIIDNVDSMREIAEEVKFVPAIKRFITDCNFFFGQNLENDQEYEGVRISDIIKKTKFLLFLSTRLVTIKRFVEIEPSLERTYGWTSLKMPQNYYNHMEIIHHRIEKYTDCEKEYPDSPKIKSLKLIEYIAMVASRNNVSFRLFNGNIRFYIKTLCQIRQEYSLTNLLTECVGLDALRETIPEASAGENGIILSLVLNYFKDNMVFSDKLHLNEYEHDDPISISRIILTILREKGKGCSLLELFDLLCPFFSPERIAKTVWDLSEARREIWRRLLTFNVYYPKCEEDLGEQAERFKSGDNDIGHYSELDICLAGVTYVDYVLPHFEFILSRHETMAKDEDVPTCLVSRYYPLFSQNSEEVIAKNSGEKVYRFERKIDLVYLDVLRHCEASVAFAQKVMERWKIIESDYINYTIFNYSVYKHGLFNAKQSYESRLVFQHVGYIERYRRFLLKKNSSIMPINDLVGINERLVLRIKRYLALYQNSKQCFRTPKQDEATKWLMESVQRIEWKKYRDFDTKIEYDSY